MRRSKFLGILVALAAFSMVLAGCGSSGDDGGKIGPSAQEGTAKVGSPAKAGGGAAPSAPATAPSPGAQ